LTADIRAAATEIRSDPDRPIRALFTVGFCMGGRQAFLSAAMGLDLAGAIGFYGRPTPRDASDAMAPISRVDSMRGSILGVFGGADQGIPDDAVAAFDAALGATGLNHRLVTYTGAPHSFFDRKAADFAIASAAAWSEVVEFIRARTP
jgi:carboxymethylenebutenolidase